MKTETISSSKTVEFDSFTIGSPDYLAVAAFGDPGTGKTRLMATAPGLAVIPLQRKTRPTVEQVAKNLYPDRRILWPKNADEFYKYANPMEMSMMGIEESKKFHRAMVDKIKMAAWSLLKNKDVRTIGIDGGTQLHSMLIAAHYGKTSKLGTDKRVYGPPNDEFREFLISLQGKHLVMTVESGEIYLNDKGTGVMKPKGFKQIGYEMNVLVETNYSVEDGFFWDIRMCQDRAELQGDAGKQICMGDTCEFKYLAQQIRPDSELEDWE